MREVPVVVCCNEEIVCYDFTNTCSKCGRDYNFAGQSLAPRSEWGWDTGEHPDDIVNFVVWSERE
jgi:hypothetical protein